MKLKCHAIIFLNIDSINPLNSENFSFMEFIMLMGTTVFPPKSKAIRSSKNMTIIKT
jgi:hypothetical protein